jgi:hypothetical protein
VSTGRKLKAEGIKLEAQNGAAVKTEAAPAAAPDITVKEEGVA